MSSLFPHISFVVPAHNSCKHLSCLLDSLIAQSIRDFEIIIVDDASVDETADLVTSYKEQDRRICYHRLDMNRGPGAARNYGLSLAKGKYVWFVDADDEVPLGAAQSMLVMAEKTGSQIVRGNMIASEDENQFELSWFENYKTAYGGTFVEMSQLWWHYGGTFLNLVERQFLEENGIRFPVTYRIGEDANFNISCYMQAPRISLLEEVCYIYHQKPGSLTRQEVPKYESLLDESVAHFENAVLLKEFPEPYLIYCWFLFPFRIKKMREAVQFLSQHQARAIIESYGRIYQDHAIFALLPSVFSLYPRIWNHGLLEKGAVRLLAERNLNGLQDILASATTYQVDPSPSGKA